MKTDCPKCGAIGESMGTVKYFPYFHQSDGYEKVTFYFCRSCNLAYNEVGITDPDMSRNALEQLPFDEKDQCYVMTDDIMREALGL